MADALQEGTFHVDIDWLRFTFLSWAVSWGGCIAHRLRRTEEEQAKLQEEIDSLRKERVQWLVERDKLRCAADSEAVAGSVSAAQLTVSNDSVNPDEARFDAAREAGDQSLPA